MIIRKVYIIWFYIWFIHCCLYTNCLSMVSNNCHVKFISSSIRLKYSNVEMQVALGILSSSFFIYFTFCHNIQRLKLEMHCSHFENDLAETSKFGQIKTFRCVHVYLWVRSNTCLPFYHHVDSDERTDITSLEVFFQYMDR